MKDFMDASIKHQARISKGKDKEATDIETLTCLVKNLATKMCKLKQHRQTHSQVTIHPDRERQAFHQPTHQVTTSSLPNLRRSLCSHSISALILIFVPSTKSSTPRTLFEIGSKSLPLFAIIHSMRKVICRCSQKTLMITKMFHQMKDQVLGM